MARLSSRSKYVPQVRILLNKCKMCLLTRLLFQATNTAHLYLRESIDVRVRFANCSHSKRARAQGVLYSNTPTPVYVDCEISNRL